MCFKNKYILFNIHIFIKQKKCIKKEYFKNKEYNGKNMKWQIVNKI